MPSGFASQAAGEVEVGHAVRHPREPAAQARPPGQLAEDAAPERQPRHRDEARDQQPQQPRRGPAHRRGRTCGWGWPGQLHRTSWLRHSGASAPPPWPSHAAADGAAAAAQRRDRDAAPPPPRVRRWSLVHTRQPVDPQRQPVERRASVPTQGIAGEPVAALGVGEARERRPEAALRAARISRTGAASTPARSRPTGEEQPAQRPGPPAPDRRWLPSHSITPAPLSRSAPTPSCRGISNWFPKRETEVRRGGHHASRSMSQP